jgi:Zn-dependent protease with chaperone function
MAYWAIEKWPRGWWAWFAAASLPLIAAAVWVVPIVVDPAFNRFRPLADLGLRQEILALAARAGIPGSKVYEADRSAQTRKLNAYVTGLGSSHRIVIWDTAIREFRRDELLFVTGHEIGHYRLGHVEQGVLLMAGFSVIGFFLTWLLVRRTLRRFGAAWGVRGPSDIASLPLMILVLTLLGSLAEPVANAWSRGVERDADLYGLEITRDSDAAARAFVRMGGRNRNDPDPPALLRALLYSHPTLVERIRLAARHRPWAEGERGRFYRGEPPP